MLSRSRAWVRFVQPQAALLTFAWLQQGICKRESDKPRNRQYEEREELSLNRVSSCRKYILLSKPGHRNYNRTT